MDGSWGGTSTARSGVATDSEASSHTRSPASPASPLALARTRLGQVWERRWHPAEVVGLGVLLVVLSLALRAWVVVPAFFFLDDYVYLADARAASFDAAWLLAPYNGHLMPGARALIWLVAERGPADWGAAAGVSLSLQACASVACLWMLVRLFGPRPGILVPLAVYLSSVVTVPGLVWWAAAINLVPVQAALFCAVACWVETLRTRRPAWLAGTVLAVLVGMAFDVRGVLVLPVLAWVALAYFAEGGPVARVRSLLRDWLVPLLCLVVLGAAYTAYYLTQVESVTSVPRPRAAAALLGVALGETLPLGAVGGPWTWTGSAPPTALASTPPLLVALAWAVLLGVVGWVAARRARTLRGWALVVSYAAVLVLLVAGTRAGAGTDAGLEYRFLVESACLLALALALAVMPLPGAPGSSARRAEPRLPPAPRWLVALVVLAVVGGGVASTATYARYWHTENASADYVRVLDAGLAAVGPVELADTRVPRDVLSPLTFPRNTTRTLVEALDGDATFPTRSTDLTVVARDGTLHDATIDAEVVSRPGPRPGCGWLVRPGESVTVPMESRVRERFSWLRVGLLAGEDVDLTVSAGGTVVQQAPRPGLGELFMLHDGGFDTVRLEVADDSGDLCVDRVETGDLAPGAAR